MAKYTILYQGRDITGRVDVLECVHRDVSDGESDCLNIKMDHALAWSSWNPEKNDQIRVLRSGYDTGDMFVNTVIPEGGAYRILATGMKAAAWPKKWQSFVYMPLSAVLSLCAGECGMGYRLHGVSGGIRYPYLLRQGMGAAQFMSILAHREGAVLKALSGNYNLISVLYAQALPAMHNMRLEGRQNDYRYISRRDLKLAALEIVSPFGSGRAIDGGAADGQRETVADLPVEDAAQAKRWAKNLLLMRNRQAEALEIEMDFNPGFTAMARVNVSAEGQAAGAWLVDSAKQNLLDGRTSARLVRCIDSIV